ncbi:phosphotransferase enzyme domain protein, partial [SAR86 cluster bacterium]|nr:phosphotransferase enzyme domain protein [SAR86 cluster bacterium]
YILWPSESISKDITRKKRILSPSDYGFHNSLEDSKNMVHFLDFDYFGWDDPVKLVADFYWHPGMNLNKSTKERWLKEMKLLFRTTDDNFLQRLESALPIYGLRWILIILNIYNPKVIERRMHASGGLRQNISQIKKLQLIKADKLAAEIMKYLNK